MFVKKTTQELPDTLKGMQYSSNINFKRKDSV